MSPFPPCCPGWQQHKETQGTRVEGMTLLGVDKCPSLVPCLLKMGDFAEEGEAKG